MADDNGSPAGGNPNPNPDPNPGAAAPWYGKDTAPEIVGLLETKGWKENPLGLIQGYQQLETFVGADKAGRGIVLPKDLNDAAAMAPIFDKLGRPAKPEEYQLPVPEGDDGTLAKHFAPILHEAGLTRAQAVKVAEAWNKFQVDGKAALETKAKADSDKAETALKLEWDREYDKNVETARRGAKAIGIDEDKLGLIEAALGYGDTMKMFRELGVKLGEDKFTLGEAGGKGAITTVEGARARLEALKKDKDWQDRWAKGGAAEIAEKAKLDEIIAGAAQAA